MAAKKKKSPAKASRSSAKPKPAARKAPKNVSKPAKKVASKKVPKAVKKGVAKKVLPKKASKPAKKVAAKKIAKPVKKASKPTKKATKKVAKPIKKGVPKKVSKPAKTAAPTKVRKPLAASKGKSKRPKIKLPKGHVVGMKEMIALGQPVAKDNLDPWLKRQQSRLLALKDSMLDNIAGMTRDSLRTEDGGSSVSAHGLHQADAGSDAYDRDFALTILSKDKDSLVKIDDALRRIERGEYGICEMSGKSIPKARLEALPFARYTVECQQEMERKNRFSNVRQPITRMFDTIDEGSDEESDEESAQENKE